MLRDTCMHRTRSKVWEWSNPRFLTRRKIMGLRERKKSQVEGVQKVSMG